MLSYRHGFHAGNFADVLKHSLLALVINALKQKDKPFVYIDTHAGAGKYSFKSEFAEKTGEYREGIFRVWEAQSQPEEIRDYLAAVRAENTGNQLVRYPGSPQLVRRLVRPQDRLQLSELHPSDFASLQQLFAADKQVCIAKEDGLQIINAYRRFATGIYGLWYPIVDRNNTERLLNRLQASGIRKQLRIEHRVLTDGSMRGMTGSGMLFINPPWQLQRQAEILLPWLNQTLTDGQGDWTIEWLVPETA